MTPIFFGSFFLIAATYISTVSLTNLEQRITETSGSLDGHLSKTKSILSMSIFYELKSLKFQMDAFQRNVLVQTNAPHKAIEYFNKRMEKEMGKLAEGWNTLMSGKEYNNIKSEIVKKTDEIKTNSSLTHLEKIEKLMALKLEGVKKLNSRQTEAEKQFDKNKLLLVTFKKQHANWKSCFMWFQIFGLILIFLSQLFEKFIVKPNREITA